MKKTNDVSELKKKSTHNPTTTTMTKFFVVFMGVNLFIGIVMASASGGDAWKSMLFHTGNITDLFMDFFNSIRDGGSPNVYSERNNIYPPLCILIFRLFSKMIPPSLVSSRFEERYSLQLEQLCMMIYILFAVICILAMMRLIESYSQRVTMGKLKTEATVMSFALIISYPVMFCLERGNILILSVVFAMFFIFFKDSKNTLVRELSYIALACSAGIKIYPAVFGLILIIEKKYKDAVRLLIYGVLIVVCPIVFFIDFNSTSASISSQIGVQLASLISIKPIAVTAADTQASSMISTLIENLLSFATTKKSRLNFSSVSIQNFVFMIDGTQQTIAKIICLITECIAFVAAFFTKKEWMRVFLLTYLMLNIPSASNSYALSFLIIPFCIFLFSDKSKTKRDWVYLASYALLLVPLPTFWYYHVDSAKKLASFLGLYYNPQLNQDIATFVFQFLFFFVVGDCIVLFIKSKKAQKSVTAETMKSEDETPDAHDSSEGEAASA